MKAFYEGEKGFWENKYNPYDPDTYNYREWERGYNSAYFYNLEKLNVNRKRG